MKTTPPRLFIKRDDCTGLAGGGNKTRKLEYLLGEALASGCDTVVTTGAVQSNHARQTAAAAAAAGLRCILVLFDTVPYRGGNYRSSGNLLLDRVLGAEVRIEPADADAAGVFGKLMERSRREAESPISCPWADRVQPVRSAMPTPISNSPTSWRTPDCPMPFLCMHRRAAARRPVSSPVRNCAAAGRTLRVSMSTGRTMTRWQRASMRSPARRRRQLDALCPALLDAVVLDGGYLA